MPKNTLIINSGLPDSDWFEYFEGLNIKGLNFFLLASDPKLLSYFSVKGWDTKNYRELINPAKNNYRAIIFFLLRPILFLSAFFTLIYYKYSKKIESVVCFDVYEKIHFTRAGKLLNLKIVWVFNPGKDTEKIPKLSISSLKRLSKKSVTICFTKNCQKILSSKKFNLKNIETVKIGISNKYYQEQKNIFQSLAKNNSEKANKKYFTVGTIQDLSGNVDHIEKLFHAIKKCLEVIPQIQLVIAGDGPERKKLSWMTRKMEISNLIWFVGNHKNPQKWLANFDLFISTSPRPCLRDLNTILYASSNSLPVIAPLDCGFDEFINNQESGLLVDIENSEDIAQAIILLQQNSFKREKIGKNGQEFVSNNFQLDNTVKELYEIIKR